MTLEEIRQKYPQYNNLSDETLTLEIHRKYYSDKPFDEIARKLGYQGNPNADIDTTTGLRNLPLRIKLSFVENPEHRLRLVKTMYPEARRLGDGRIVYMNPETGKDTTIDEEARSVADLADWVGMIPEIAGTTVGAIAAAPIPIPGARFVGGGAGYAIGREVKDVIGRQFTGAPPAAMEAPVGEYAKRKAGEFAVGTAMEFGGEVALKTVSPFGKKVLPVTKRAMNYFKRYGGRFTPAQVTETRVLDLLENVAESSLFGGGRMVDFKRTQTEIISNIAEDMARRFGNGASHEEVGILIQKSIEGKKQAFNAAMKAMYKQVDELTEGVMVSTASLKKRAAELLKEHAPMKLTPSLKDKTTVRMLKDFSKLPDEVPFSYLQQWRSDLLQVGHAPTDLIPGKAAGMAKHLAKQIDDLFEQVEGGLSGEALTALRATNAVYRQGKEIFNHKIIKGLANAEPAKIADTIFRPGNNQVIRMVRKMLGHEDFKQLRGHYINKLLFKDSLDTAGNISWKKLTGQIRNMRRGGTLKAILSKSQIDELETFARVVRTQQEKIAGVGGGMLVQLTQAGAIIELGGAIAMGKGMTRMGGTILLGPAALSQLFTRKYGMRWLGKGLVTRPGTQQATRLAGRILSLAGMRELKLVPEEPEFGIGP